MNDFIELYTDFGVSYFSKKALRDRGVINANVGNGSMIYLNGRVYQADASPSEIMALLEEKDNQLNG